MTLQMIKRIESLRYKRILGQFCLENPPRFIHITVVDQQETNNLKADAVEKTGMALQEDFWLWSLSGDPIISLYSWYRHDCFSINMPWGVLGREKKQNYLGQRILTKTAKKTVCKLAMKIIQAEKEKKMFNHQSCWASKRVLYQFPFWGLLLILTPIYVMNDWNDSPQEVPSSPSLLLKRKKVIEVKVGGGS